MRESRVHSEASTSSSVHDQPVQDSTDLPPTLEQELELIEEDPSELIDELEEELDNDFDLGGFRERRMQEMRDQLSHSPRAD